MPQKDFTDIEFIGIVKDSYRWKDLMEKIGYTMWSSRSKNICVRRMKRLGMLQELERLKNLRKHLKSHHELKPKRYGIKRRNTSSLWSKLEVAGRLKICEWCRCEHMTLHEGEWIWNGKVLKLQIDHIHGFEGDDPDRIENLRILCPQCHASTSNWGKHTKPRPAAKTKRKSGWPKKPHINAMRKSGREYICAHCNCDKFVKHDSWGWLWNDWPVKLEVNHINGRKIENPNHLSNLEYICTQCHTQTGNWCGNSNAKTNKLTVS